MSYYNFSRRGALLAVAAIASMPSTIALAANGLNGTENLLLVTKDPSCGCCSGWAELATKAGFKIEVTDTRDYAGMKQAADVPEDLWSCHTTRISGYIVEGHVPFAAIRKLLDERPDITGIAVPGMPAGSPGMGGGVDATAKVIAWGGSAGDGQPFPIETQK